MIERKQIYLIGLLPIPMRFIETEKSCTEKTINFYYLILILIEFLKIVFAGVVFKENCKLCLQGSIPSGVSLMQFLLVFTLIMQK